MARAPDIRAGQARELFLAGKPLIEISKLLNVPEGTVRSWKNRYKWEEESNATLRKPECNVAKERGGQPGNKNAAGHGGTGPPGNKNAIRTGEFESLFFDTLSQDEQKLIEAMPLGKEELLLQEIQLLTVRERRMLQRIDDLNQAAGNQAEKKNAGMTAVKRKGGVGANGPVDVTEYEGVIGQVQSVEDALTRVQARKQKAVDSLHRFGYDDSRLELEMMKVELGMLKDAGQEPGMEDDGFMDAMNNTASNVWGDENA